MTALAALQHALATEHAVVYGYGLVGAHLSGTERATARQALDAHRAYRDALADAVRAAGGEPVAAEPAYEPSAPVTDRASALALAVRLEDSTAGAAYDVVRVTRGDARTLTVGGLGDAAARGARWRVAVAPAAPEVVTFPGRG